MKEILLIILFLFISCQKPFKKPFIIFDKKINQFDDRGFYQYQDANGRTFEFIDNKEAYKIGDTIK